VQTCALPISGTVSKLYSGGGDVVAHSSVSPCQGSLPAGAPCLRLRHQFQKVSRTPNASRKAPIVDSRFQTSHPSPGWYVYVRRGWPSRPEMCIGKNVKLNPTNIVQNDHFPSRSSSIRPVIFGSQ